MARCSMLGNNFAVSRVSTAVGNMYVEWLERYLKEAGGVEEQGWRNFFEGLLRAPPEDVVVKQLIKRPLGGSGTNPFLKDRQTAVRNVRACTRTRIGTTTLIVLPGACGSRVVN